ncbi:MAG: hypothetical protein NTW30_05035 [Candidatus Aenigmarchaeota archaeon]|nr:hypothetical protein [Candidatus Aenigmarchaeota archaeon]
MGYLEGNDAAHILKEMMYQAASHHLNPSTLTYDKRYVELNEAAKKYVSHKITI